MSRGWWALAIGIATVAAITALIRGLVFDAVVNFVGWLLIVYVVFLVFQRLGWNDSRNSGHQGKGR